MGGNLFRLSDALLSTNDGTTLVGGKEELKARGVTLMGNKLCDKVMRAHSTAQPQTHFS